MRRVALVALLLAPLARGDEETALYFVDRAKQSIEDKDLAKAEHWIQRALKEEKAYAPALFQAAALAELQGRRAQALQHLESCVAQAGTSGLSADERHAIKQARARLAKLDKARFEFQEIVEEYVEEVAALARRKQTTDPELARECWRNILLVRPDHAEARKRVAGKAEPEPERGDALFNGTDLKGWGGKQPAWSVRDGSMFGSVADAANVNRYEREVKGDYSLTCELRVVKDIGDDPLFGIVFGLVGSYDHFGLWIWTKDWRLEHQTGEFERDELHSRAFRSYDGKYDRFAWNTYRIDVEGKRVTGYVNGKKIWSTSGAVRSLDGYVGLWVQEQTVEIRKVILAQK